MKVKTPLFGLMGEFDTPEELMAAARRAHQAGYRRMDAYSPFPIHGMAEMLGYPGTKLPRIVLLGGLCGCLGGFLLQYWVSVVAYPLNIGGRPLNSWPSFIPVTFETTILVAAFAAVLGMLGLNRLPAPYHPVFNVPRFALASRDRFFLCIEASDPRFDLAGTRRELEEWGGQNLVEVEN